MRTTKGVCKAMTCGYERVSACDGYVGVSAVGVPAEGNAGVATGTKAAGQAMSSGAYAGRPDGVSAFGVSAFGRFLCLARYAAAVSASGGPDGLYDCATSLVSKPCDVSSERPAGVSAFGGTSGVYSCCVSIGGPAAVSPCRSSAAG